MQYTNAANISTAVLPDFHGTALNYDSVKVTTHVLGEETHKPLFCGIWAFET